MFLVDLVHNSLRAAAYVLMIFYVVVFFLTDEIVWSNCSVKIYKKQDFILIAPKISFYKALNYAVQKLSRYMTEIIEIVDGD